MKAINNSAVLTDDYNIVIMPYKEAYNMKAKVIGIGNSTGIVIPASLLRSLGLKKNDTVTISETEGGFVVKKETEKAGSFEDLICSYYGLSYDEAIAKFFKEPDDVSVDWGEARGEEIW